MSEALATRPTNPMEILAVMVEKGCDVGTLERMQAMAERWADREAERAFNEAMVACQAEMPTVPWQGKNEQTNSRFAYIETIIDKCKPVWIKHGFAPQFTEGECSKPDMKRIICRLGHVEGHTKEYFLDLYNDGIGAKGNAIGNMNRLQGQGSTASYGKRYLLTMIFNLRIAGEDNDAQQFLTEDQIATINGLLEETHADIPAFLEWAGVQKVSDIAPKKFADCVKALQRKKQKAGAK